MTGELARLEPSVSGPIVAAFRVLDALAFAAAGLLGQIGDAAWPTVPAAQAFLIAFVSLLGVNVLQLCGLYSGRVLANSGKSLLPSMILMVVSMLGVPTLWAVLGGPQPAFGWELRWTEIALVWLLASRLCLSWSAAKLAAAGPFRRRVLIVGDTARATALMRQLENQPLAVSIGDLAHLRDSLKASKAEDVIIALPWNEEEALSAAIATLREYPVGVHVVPEDSPPLRKSLINVMGGTPVLTLSNRPLEGWGRFLKAAEDRVIAFLIIVLISPLLLAIAIAIKLGSKGPVLFRQKRYGFNNEVFVVFKFRSMYLHQATPSIEQAKRDDPRITPVGRFLRRTSLDELPQLFNVLIGTMSLVGPRPHAVEHQNYYQNLVDEYRCRHRMRPGITGWAQVNGFRGETATVELMRKRVEYDLYYIEHWSVFLDLWILFLTPFACLWGKNAY